MYLIEFETLSGMAEFFLILGWMIFLLNLYGVSRRLEPACIKTEHLHFVVKGSRPSYRESLRQAVRIEGESDVILASRLNLLVARRLVHIQWLLCPPALYHQRVPVWENFFLWFIGISERWPQFHRYHFTNWKRSLRRGIGVCGDKSMTLVQLLERNGINAVILSNAQHVIVGAELGDDYICFDPDYGVEFSVRPHEILANWTDISQRYDQAGADRNNIMDLADIYTLPFTTWRGVAHFATNRFRAEALFYLLKWVFPALLICGSLLLLSL
jgi:hypothetical protein